MTHRAKQSSRDQMISPLSHRAIKPQHFQYAIPRVRGIAYFRGWPWTLLVQRSRDPAVKCDRLPDFSDELT
jgi:hypothetical protein